jgi:hypothetical protein
MGGGVRAVRAGIVLPAGAPELAGRTAGGASGRGEGTGYSTIPWGPTRPGWG